MGDISKRSVSRASFSPTFVAAEESSVDDEDLSQYLMESFIL